MFPLLALTLALPFVARAQVLVDFQVTQPPPIPADAKQCTTFLFEHSFATSFGIPALVHVTPSTECGPVGSWVGITLNLTCTSNGTQFDRLAIVSFEGSEIWRSSTPEPSQGAGIIWTYIKDVTRYIPLLSKPGTLQLELDNGLFPDMGLDGIYDVRMSITYYASSFENPPAPKASLIVPVTNFTSVPPDFSTLVTFPTNTIEAYAEVYAHGNGDEEFWYFNTANEFLPAGSTPQDGPFRDVRLLVDGQLAGVAFPYPVYFTGAIAPNAWRPITSYGALDQPTYVIDLTPFVPLLANGKPHNITLDVLSAEPDRSITQNWFVSSLVQVITDTSTKPTTGNITLFNAPQFATTSTTGNVDASGDTNVTVTASHAVHIEADVISGSGKKNHVVWKQNLQYSNFQTFTGDFTVQAVTQKSSGTISSTHNRAQVVTDNFDYPMAITILSTPDGSNLSAHFDHSLIRTLLPSPFILGTTINNHQIADGVILTLPSGIRTGNGNNTNTFTYRDTAGNTFNRKVTAVLNNITQDEVSGSLAGRPAQTFPRPFVPPPKGSVLPFAARMPKGRNLKNVVSDN